MSIKKLWIASDNFLLFPAFIWIDNVSTRKPGPSSGQCSPRSVCPMPSLFFCVYKCYYNLSYAVYHAVCVTYHTNVQKRRKLSDGFCKINYIFVSFFSRFSYSSSDSPGGVKSGEWCLHQVGITSINLTGDVWEEEREGTGFIGQRSVVNNVHPLIFKLVKWHPHLKWSFHDFSTCVVRAAPLDLQNEKGGLRFFYFI